MISVELLINLSLFIQNLNIWASSCKTRVEVKTCKNLQKNDFLFDKIFIDGRWQKCKFISKKDLKENNDLA